MPYLVAHFLHLDWVAGWQVAGGREEREDMGEEGGRGLGEGAWRVENRACNIFIGNGCKTKRRKVDRGKEIR